MIVLFTSVAHYMTVIGIFFVEMDFPQINIDLQSVYNRCGVMTVFLHTALFLTIGLLTEFKGYLHYCSFYSTCKSIENYTLIFEKKFLIECKTKKIKPRIVNTTKKINQINYKCIASKQTKLDKYMNK